MAQVSIGQVDNLQDLMRGLYSVREALGTACSLQIDAAEHKYQGACKEAHQSNGLLESATRQEIAASHASDEAEHALDQSRSALASARSSLSSCMSQPRASDGTGPDCSDDHASVDMADGAVLNAQGLLSQARAELTLSKEIRQSMEQRVDLVRQAQATAEQVLTQTRQECRTRLASVDQAIAVGAARVSAAQQALDAYLSTTPSAAEFHAWLKWDPGQHRAPITPDLLRDRMTLSSEQRRLLQDYLYDRNPSYRGQVDKYRAQWAAAQGDAERNMVARKARTHLAGEFGEQIVRHALAPIGGRIETQGRTFVGDNGRYTKTDLLVTDLRVAVVLGRGEGMGAPVGGSMAFEIKCGKADYLFSQMAHMVFQAEGHKQADARCTLCSRDIHDLPPEKQQALRERLRAAGSPLIGMLPTKNEIDQSCLAFIDHDQEVQP